MWIIKGLAALGLAAGATASSVAQPGHLQTDIPKVEFAVHYSYLRANATPGRCGCFSLNGGTAEVAVRFYRSLSVVGDVTGDYAGTTSVPGQSLSLLSYTAGPRLSYPLRRSHPVRVTPFIQGLFGAVHGFDAPFPNGSGTVSRTANALALFAGGGVDVVLSHRFAIRAVQLDYGLNRLPNNATNSESLLRVSTGVAFRIR
jgi:peptidoglycan-associated lipoprotein